MGLDGAEDLGALNEYLMDVGGVLVQVEKVLLDAYEENVVEAFHDVDLKEIFHGVGHGYVKEDVRIGSQPAGGA